MDLPIFPQNDPQRVMGLHLTLHAFIFVLHLPHLFLNFATGPSGGVISGTSISPADGTELSSSVWRLYIHDVALKCSIGRLVPAAVDTF